MVETMTTRARTVARRTGASGAVALGTVAMLLLVPVPGWTAQPADRLPLGDADLVETRTDEPVADGVTLTRIVRGTEPAPPDAIATTPRGPWTVTVLRIDADAPGRLQATHGADLARVEPTTELVRQAGALAGVNASFFSFTADPSHPGEPVGLAVDDGRLVSEPTAAADEVHLLLGADGSAVVDRLTWAASVTGRESGATVPVDSVNHPPVVPPGCPAPCMQPGDTVRITPEFAASTPAGPGVEIVLDAGGCVVRSAPTRGVALAADQTSLQATGDDLAALVAGLGPGPAGCVDSAETLTGAGGDEVTLRPGSFAVNGRGRLVAGGETLVPAGTSVSAGRNPRTIAGTAADGAIVLATIDGRQATSVGTTLAETAAVAAALGMTEAINLDGGGSTTMVVGPDVVNRPPGGPREVGDALVYLPG